MDSSKSTAKDVRPRPTEGALPAATVTIVRDSSKGLEVLMMRRNLKSGFVPGMYVFPGGGVDESDSAYETNGLCAGFDDNTASSLLNMANGGLAYWVAAIREAYEEAGLLLANHAQGGPLSFSDAAYAARFVDYRKQLNAGTITLAAILQAENLRLATDQLQYFAHWITPVGAPRRYNTRFFMAEAPREQEPFHDECETIGSTWIRPGEALSLHRKGEFEMRTPTVKTLERFEQYELVSTLRHELSSQREVRELLPRIAKDGTRLLPGDPGYDTAGTPEGAGKW